MKRFKRRNSAQNSDIYLYGAIESDDYSDASAITPRFVRKELDKLSSSSEINVHICSNGGDVFAGNCIYSMLRQFQGRVNIYVEGVAASIASVICCAGDRVFIAPNAMIMVHPASTMLHSFYTASELLAEAKTLQQCEATILNAYREATGLDDYELQSLMQADGGSGTWMDADMAIELGFADEITPESEVPQAAARQISPHVYDWQGVRIDLSKYSNAPKMGVFSYQNTDKRKRGNKTMARRKRARVRNEVILVLCPVCGEEFEVDLSAGESEPVARAGRRRNEIQLIDCPACGAAFEWDIAADTDGAAIAVDPETLVEVVEEAIPEVVNRRWNGVRSRGKRKISRRINEIATAECPDCGAFLEFDDDGSAVTLTCAECGAEFDWPPALDDAEGAQNRGALRFLSALRRDGKTAARASGAKRVGSGGGTAKRIASFQASINKKRGLR